MILMAEPTDSTGTKIDVTASRDVVVSEPVLGRVDGDVPKAPGSRMRRSPLRWEDGSPDTRQVL